VRTQGNLEGASHLGAGRWPGSVKESVRLVINEVDTIIISHFTKEETDAREIH
jgi:hypothetical protein